jgi:hypothetical protein
LSVDPANGSVFNRLACPQGWLINIL